MTVSRRLQHRILEALTHQPAVTLLGPRQVGKTTLAWAISETQPSIYLDLERPSDRAKITDVELYLRGHEDKLVILDEIQRVPELFPALRGLIDEGRRRGRRSGRFLLLGSASIELLRQSSESLAGRNTYLELAPLDLLELEEATVALDDLWARGGFPESVLAKSNAQSLRWREDFIRTYLERDIPQLGPRIPAETLRRFWTMLAHCQAGILNASKLGAGLGVSGQTVARYTDLLVDLLLVRRLMPIHRNLGKRLVKSPKVYIRDSGIVHALLAIADRDGLLGHPVAGSSWEGFVVETLINAAPEGTIPSFYRTTVGAEIDLVLELPGGCLWALEIKHGLTPTLSKGFHLSCADLAPQRTYVVYSGEERYPLKPNVEVIGLRELAAELHEAR